MELVGTVGFFLFFFFTTMRIFNCNQQSHGMTHLITDRLIPILFFLVVSLHTVFEFAAAEAVSWRMLYITYEPTYDDATRWMFDSLAPFKDPYFIYFLFL
jgi:hypothetical protein